MLDLYFVRQHQVDVCQMGFMELSCGKAFRRSAEDMEQAGVATVVRPVAGIPGAFRTNGSLRSELDRAEAANADLRNRLDKVGYDDQRRRQLEGLRAVAGDLGYALLPARVIAIGAAQSFSSTVTRLASVGWAVRTSSIRARSRVRTRVWYSASMIFPAERAAVQCLAGLINTIKP